ncbi:hypothetical protein CEXT_611311 [Caerostris extrusa]|uniref:Uncharacterized protein n=1 Tax=Caerostris extrusa TaxID=172846 RepID=A0AAV4MHH3_CAEEX|nr:hypothetical protein CEXT_611311 [Caerostris extrusa]
MKCLLKSHLTETKKKDKAGFEPSRQRGRQQLSSTTAEFEPVRKFVFCARAAGQAQLESPAKRAPGQRCIVFGFQAASQQCKFHRMQQTRQFIWHPVTMMNA